jgi:chaperonin GroES
MNLRPLYNRVIIERNEAPEKTKSGLYIPSSSSKKPNNGTVLAVGNGHLQDDGNLKPLQVKIGDVVVFSEYSGSNITHNGNEYHILSEDEILGIISSEN